MNRKIDPNRIHEFVGVARKANVFLLNFVIIFKKRRKTNSTFAKSLTTIITVCLKGDETALARLNFRLVHFLFCNSLFANLTLVFFFVQVNALATS